MVGAKMLRAELSAGPPSDHSGRLRAMSDFAPTDALERQMRTLADNRFSDIGRTQQRPKPLGLRASGSSSSFNVAFWLRGQDLNLGPSGYEPDELPGCSTPRCAYFWAPDQVRGIVRPTARRASRWLSA